MALDMIFVFYLRNHDVNLTSHSGKPRLLRTKHKNALSGFLQKLFYLFMNFGSNINHILDISKFYKIMLKYQRFNYIYMNVKNSYWLLNDLKFNMVFQRFKTKTTGWMILDCPVWATGWAPFSLAAHPIHCRPIDSVPQRAPYSMCSSTVDRPAKRLVFHCHRRHRSADRIPSVLDICPTQKHQYKMPPLSCRGQTRMWKSKIAMNSDPHSNEVFSTNGFEFCSSENDKSVLVIGKVVWYVVVDLINIALPNP